MTLMELLVVLGVFSLTVMMTSAIFLQSNDVQRRVLAVTDAQADLRFVLEAIVREVRSGRIDYDFYQGSGGVSVPADRLIVRSAAGEREEFFLETSPIVCPEAVQGCVALSLDGGAAQSLTSGRLNVENVLFYVHPEVDPFTIDPSSGSYASDDQPTVTVVIRARTVASKPRDVVPVSAQTTVTSRTYVR